MKGVQVQILDTNMNRSVYRIFFFCAITLLLLNACAAITTPQDSPPPLLDTRWRLTSISTGGQPVALISGSQISLNFEQDQVSGNAGCNQYFGEYQVEGEQMTIGPLANTEMYCMEPEGLMDQEGAYLETLGQAATYQSQGAQLEIYAENGVLILVYEAAPPASLSRESLGNSVYINEWTQAGLAPLQAGEYREQIMPDSATEIIVSLIDPPAYGQLSAGEPAAAVILVTDPGGSGTFYDLALVVEQDGEPLNIASTQLGDRIQINALYFQDGAILVDMITQGPDDPFCCPTLQVLRRYELQDEQLLLIDEQILGE
jgi:heat shock protein HslJ